jgi:alpha-tubulin suppressor-like RCC1 family protein
MDSTNDWSTAADSSVPVVAQGITTAADTSSNYRNTCVVLLNGTVSCFGDNSLGQLGNGTTTNSSVPVSVSGITTATNVAVGNLYACALLSDHSVSCWGADNYHQFEN